MYTIKQNDTRPRLVANLLQNFGQTDEAAIVLSTATSVRLLMRERGVGSPATVEGVCSITDADTGEVTYTWAAGDTASSGTYDLEFEITWADGGVETVPSSGYETVVIEDDLG